MTLRTCPDLEQFSHAHASTAFQHQWVANPAPETRPSKSLIRDQTLPTGAALCLAFSATAPVAPPSVQLVCAACPGSASPSLADSIWLKGP